MHTILSADDQFSNLIHNVITLRQRNGLSLREMAAILHITPYMLRKLERGEISSRLYIDFLFYLRAHFGVSFYDLFQTRL